jgi:hypothetical protein
VFNELGEEGMNILVYHGGTDVIQEPLCTVGRENLDFGQGFYLTDLKEQGIRWAKTIAGRRKEAPILNIYTLERDAILQEARCKVFQSYDSEWLHFIAANRLGQALYREFDYIEGGVADDRVIDTVNLFIADLINEQEALKRLSLYQPSNQMCLLHQSIINQHLKFYGSERL